MHVYEQSLRLAPHPFTLKTEIPAAQFLLSGHLEGQGPQSAHTQDMVAYTGNREQEQALGAARCCSAGVLWLQAVVSAHRGGRGEGDRFRVGCPGLGVQCLGYGTCKVCLGYTGGLC